MGCVKQGVSPGRKLSAQEVGQVAYNAGWRGNDLVNAIAVSFAENGGHYEACFNGSCCWGLWQYSEVHGVPIAQMTDAQTNADLAYKLWRATGWAQSWTTYPVAAAAHLPAARRVASRIDQGGGTTSGGGKFCGDTSVLEAGVGGLYDFHGKCRGMDPGSKTCVACLKRVCSNIDNDTPQYDDCIATVSGLTGGAADTTHDFFGTASDLASAVRAIAGAFLFLINPANWIRIAEVVGGAFLLLLAIVFLFLYSHRDEVKGIARSVA